MVNKMKSLLTLILLLFFTGIVSAATINVPDEQPTIQAGIDTKNVADITKLPLINEVMSSNQATIEDEDGDSPDWIEIYNNGDSTIDLAGYGLSDDLSDPFKWVFPSVSIIPSHHLLVFASDKNRTTGNELHTNFKIKSGGETLVLTDSSGTLCDSISTGEIVVDLSRGRLPDGGSEWVLFADPTPGDSNTTRGYQGISNAVVDVSLPGGFYNGSVSVELSSNSPDTDIRYTLDGSEPNDSSLVYSSPVVIDTTTVVRARPFEEDLFSPRITTHTYFINFDSTLPVISLSTDPDNLFDEEIGIYAKGNDYDPNDFYSGNFFQDWERPVHVEFYEPNGNMGFSIDCGIQIAGLISRVKAQKAFRLYTRPSYGYDSINYQIFPDLPITEFKRIDLRNNGNEEKAVHFRDALAQSLVKDLDIDIQAYRPAVVFINGVYWGIYNIRERQDERYLASHYGIDPNNVDILQFLPFIENPEVIVGDMDNYISLINYIETHDMSDPSSYDYVKTRIDMDNFIDYNVTEIYCANTNWPLHNVKFWRSKTPGSKWRWFLQDLDWGFEGSLAPGGYKENTLVTTTDENKGFKNLLLRNLLKNNKFLHEFINRFADYMNSIFIPENIIKRIDDMKSVLEPEMPNFLDRWRIEEIYEGWALPSSMEEWYDNIQLVIDFAENRPEHMRSHIRIKFGLNKKVTVNLDVSPPEAGKIKISSLIIDNYPWEGIYFPDVPIPLKAIPNRGYKFVGWTGISPEDSLSVTVTLTDDVSVTAIFEKNSSALNNIVINEINYNSSLDFNPGDWVELYNAYNIPIDISGWIFKDSNYANRFDIPENTIIAPDDYIVLCSDDSLFSEAFPDVNNYIGNLGFNLSNAGELIRLYNSQGDIVDSLTYDDVAPWPEEPDGTGVTLALLNPSRNNAMYYNWTSSSNYGTPGEINDVFTSVDETTQSDVPIVFSLKQNYPNPFNPTTVIEFSLPQDSFVSLIIYNIMGQIVRELISDNFRANTHSIIWDGKDDNGTSVSSGIYISKLVSGEHESISKMLLVK